MKTATAVFSFQAECPDELSLTTGDKLIVMDCHSSIDWWLVKRNTSYQTLQAAASNRGLVPASFLEVDMPIGWDRTVDDDGDTYYYNRDSGLTQYEFPSTDFESTTTTTPGAPIVLPEIVTLQRSRELCDIQLVSLHKRLETRSPQLVDPVPLTDSTSSNTNTYSGGSFGWLRGNQLALVAANKVVVVQPEDHFQPSVTLHGQDRIVTLSVHPNGVVLVTGDSANNIIVWDPSTLQKALASFATDHRSLAERKHGEDNAIRSVNFSPSGTYLAVLLDKTIEIFEWAKAKNILVARTGGRSSLGFNSLMFNPSEVGGQSTISRKALVSIGPDQIKFWALSPLRIKGDGDDAEVEYRLEGNTWSPQLKNQPAGAPETPDTFTCMGFAIKGISDAYPLSSVFTGTSGGKVWIWQQLVRRMDRRSDLRIPKPFGRLIAVVNDVHEAPLAAIAISRSHLMTCDTQGVVSLWGWTEPSARSSTTSSCPFQHAVSFSLPIDGVGFGQAIALNPAYDDGTVLAVVGTSTNNLLTMSLIADSEADQLLVKYLIKS